MTIQFKEGSKYLLEQSIFNRSILTCNCVQDGVAYLSSESPSQAYTEKVEYKYNIKKQRMYAIMVLMVVYLALSTTMTL